MKNFVLRPIPPFNYDLTLRIVINRFDGKEVLGDALSCKGYYLVLSLDDKVIPLLISSNHVVEDPFLRVRFLTEVGEDEIEKCLNVVGWVFDINLDLRLFYKSVREDEVLNNVIKRLYGLRFPSTPTLFEAFIKAFIEQQLPLSVSTKIANRVIRRFGRFIEIGGVKYYAFPQARQLAFASVDELRECGLSRRKSLYVRDFSRLVLEGEILLDEVWTWSEERLLRELVKIKGVGVWTAEYVMIRGMRRYSSTPASDLFLKKVLSHYYLDGRKISGDEAREICNKWSMWKGLASFYLIVDYLLHDRTV